MYPSPDLRPRDHLGRFIPTDCCPDPNCDGQLLAEWDPLCDEIVWRCNGLINPGTTVQELQSCRFEHRNGSTYPPKSEARDG